MKKLNAKSEKKATKRYKRTFISHMDAKRTDKLEKHLEENDLRFSEFLRRVIDNL